MAHKEDSQGFKDLVSRANDMSAGIKKYKGDKAHAKKMPPSLDAAGVTELRARMEANRAGRIKAQREADKFSTDYQADFAALEKLLAKHDESVRGYLGKSNAAVSDFGTHPIVPGPGRPKKPKEPKEPKTKT